jgi:hypothetical protein
MVNNLPETKEMVQLLIQYRSYSTIHHALLQLNNHGNPAPWNDLMTEMFVLWESVGSSISERHYEQKQLEISPLVCSTW